jgi:hypothetical protein
MLCPNGLMNTRGLIEKDTWDTTSLNSLGMQKAINIGIKRSCNYRMRLNHDNRERKHWNYFLALDDAANLVDMQSL